LTIVRDPVCGMTVDDRNARYKAETGGKKYYFCSSGCLASFTADPSKYSH
jgi:P-type Cu+ transporter